jgi:hypothetical protein
LLVIEDQNDVSRVLQIILICVPLRVSAVLIFALFAFFCGYPFFLGSSGPFAEIPGSFGDQSGGADKAGDTDR